MGWLLHTVVGGGLLLLLAHVLAARIVQPARRQRLAEWAMTAALLLALLSMAPAWLLVALPEPGPSDASPPTPAAAPVAAVQPANDPVPLPAMIVARHEAIPAAAPAPPAAVPASKIVPARAEPRWVARSAPSPSRFWLDRERLTVLMLAAYATGAGVLLARWLLGYAALAYLLHGAVPVGGRVGRLFKIMTLTYRRRPRLLLAPRVRVPFSCGLWRPAVVLPVGLAQDASPEVLRWVLAHELTHLRRRDARANLLFGLGQVVYFYLPWFWRLARQVRLCQEYVADAVAAAEGRPEDYAQFLLGWTTAPALPAGAAGVTGHSSDLYRRITMLLQSPVRVEPRCPRRWSLTAAVGLLALAVLGASVGLRAYAAPAPAKEPKEPKEPGKARPKEGPKDPAAAPALPPEFEDLLKRMPPGLDPAQIKMMRRQMEIMRKRMEEMRRRPGGLMPPPAAFGGFGGFAGGFPPRMPGMPGGFSEPRLGARVAAPSATLADQLDLPRDQGLVLENVPADSAAGKAGLKSHDILLEVDGKPVPNKIAELPKFLVDVKAGKAVEAVVLRKGKKETIKGLSLPEARALPGFAPGAFPPGFNPPAFPKPPRLPIGGLLPPGGMLPPGFGGGRTVMTTTFRTADGFTTRHQEGSLIITVTGKVDDGKQKVTEIQVQDGGAGHRYESVDKVPERYKAKVKNLVDMTEKSKVRIDIKAP